jgi:hypothetical protein
MPSVPTKNVATHTARRAACGFPAPSSFETLVLTPKK